MLQSVSGGPVSVPMTIVISGIAKMFVGELVEIGMHVFLHISNDVVLALAPEFLFPRFFLTMLSSLVFHFSLLMMIFHNFNHNLSELLYIPTCYKVGLICEQLACASMKVEDCCLSLERIVTLSLWLV